MEPTPKWNNMVVGWSIQKNKGTNIWIWRNSSRSRQPTNVTIWSQVQELANTFPEALQRRHPDKGILNGVGEHHWVCYCCMHQLSKSQFKAQVAHGGIWCPGSVWWSSGHPQCFLKNHSHLNLWFGPKAKGPKELGIYQPQPLKINGWKMNFPFVFRPIFRDEMLNFRGVQIPSMTIVSIQLMAIKPG